MVAFVGGLGRLRASHRIRRAYDLTGVWQSCFWLLFVIVAVALVWMHLAIRQMERAAAAKGVHIDGCRNFTKWKPCMDRPSREPWQPAAPSPTGGRRTGPSGTAEVRAIARRNLWISVPCLLLSFAVWMVWSVVVAKLPSVGFRFQQ